MKEDAGRFRMGLDFARSVCNRSVMEQVGYEPHLDAVFAALADPTRRAILARLSEGEASVGELAEPFAMSQPAVSKHLKVLEHAGLISRGVDRQRRPARLEAAPMAEAVRYLESFRDHWDSRLDTLDDLLKTIQKDISDD